MNGIYREGNTVYEKIREAKRRLKVITGHGYVEGFIIKVESTEHGGIWVEKKEKIEDKAEERYFIPFEAIDRIKEELNIS